MKVYALRAWEYDGGTTLSFVGDSATSRDTFLSAVIDAMAEASDHSRVGELNDFFYRSPMFLMAMKTRGFLPVQAEAEVRVRGDSDTHCRGFNADANDDTDAVLDGLVARGVELRARWR